MEETKRRRFIIRAVLEGEVDVSEEPVPPVPQYVTSGLIHRWDAIDNTGSGHDGEAAVWKDLVGDYDLTLYGNVVWGDSYAAFDGVNTTYMKSDINKIEAPQGKTVEVVFEASRTDTCTVAQLCYDQEQVSDAYGKIIIFSDNTVAVRGKAGNTYSTGESAVTDVRHIAGVYTDVPDIAAVYVNGVPAEVSSRTHSLQNTISRMVIGGSLAGDNAILSYCLLGNVYAIRIYDRNLTAEEIAQNYAVDQERFGL